MELTWEDSDTKGDKRKLQQPATVEGSTPPLEDPAVGGKRGKVREEDPAHHSDV